MSNEIVVYEEGPVTVIETPGQQGPGGPPWNLWRDDWVAGTYQAFEAVAHNGSSWIANKTTAAEPSFESLDWGYLAKVGDMHPEIPGLVTRAEAAATGAEQSEIDANTHKLKANEWAEKATEVEVGKYSAKYWAAASSQYAMNTNQDAIATAADRVQTGLDRIATGADRVQTGLDRIATGADRVQTGLDVTASGNNATAAQSARNKAEEWAEKTLEVEVGKYSAKHWAGQAEATLAAKANKVGGATTGNFAALSESGDLTDSGKKHADYAPAAAGTAAGTSYSGELAATDVQGAIDEIMSTRGTAATANIGTATGQLIGTDEAREYFGLEFEPSVLPTISSDFSRNKHELYEQYGNESKTILQTWTTTRSTTGTYRDAAGIIRTAAINTPRIDYDPVTNKGALLVEEARTNLLTYSEQFDNAAWAKTNATITANAAVAPDGTMTMDLLADSTNTTVIVVASQNKALTANTTYSLSHYVKRKDYRYMGLQPATLSNWAGDTGIRIFDLETVTQTSGPTAGSSITDLGNGIYRISIMQTFGAADASGGINIFTSSSGTGVSVPRTIGNGNYIWGAQIEAGAFQSSYIPTVASAVTRTADDVSRVLGDEFNVNSTEFTLFVEGSLPADNFRRLLRMSGPDTSGGANAIGLGAATGAMQWYAVVQRDGVTVLPAVTTAVFIPNVVNKWAMTFRAGQIIVARNGAIYQTATGLPPIGLTTIGPHHYNSASVAASNTQSLQLIPRALSNAELQEMTKL